MRRIGWLGVLALVGLTPAGAWATGWRKDSNDIHIINKRLAGRVVDYTANHGQENDPDKHLRHPQGFARALGGADEHLAHPRRQHRSADQRANGPRQSPGRTFRMRRTTAFFVHAGECLGMRFEREQQVQAIGQQEQRGDAEVQQFLLPDRVGG